MVEIACRAEWNFAFDLLGTKAIGAVNFAGAETEIDFVFGGADSITMIFEGLLEAELRVGGRLELVERDADYADWAW